MVFSRNGVEYGTPKQVNIIQFPWFLALTWGTFYAINYCQPEDRLKWKAHELSREWEVRNLLMCNKPRFLLKMSIPIHIQNCNGDYDLFPHFLCFSHLPAHTSEERARGNGPQQIDFHTSVEVLFHRMVFSWTLFSSRICSGISCHFFVHKWMLLHQHQHQRWWQAHAEVGPFHIEHILYPRNMFAP